MQLQSTETMRRGACCLVWFTYGYVSRNGVCVDSDPDVWGVAGTSGRRALAAACWSCCSSSLGSQGSHSVLLSLDVDRQSLLIGNTGSTALQCVWVETGHKMYFLCCSDLDWPLCHGTDVPLRRTQAPRSKDMIHAPKLLLTAQPLKHRQSDTGSVWPENGMEMA